MEEQTKAVQAVAMTAGKALDTVDSLGAFIGRILGTMPEDAVGILGGDLLHHVRLRNAARLQQRTEEILRQRHADSDADAVSLNVAIPLLKAAQDESRDELQELWARLLANAMDKSGPQIRQSFIATLRQFDPLDSVVMEKAYKQIDRMRGWVVYEHWSDELGIRPDELLVSLEHIKNLGCIESYGDYHFENGLGVHRLMLSAFGSELMHACQI